MVETMRNMLRVIEEAIIHMEESDTAGSIAYTKLCKKRRILKKAIRKFERLEVHSK